MQTCGPPKGTLVSNKTFISPEIDIPPKPTWGYTFRTSSPSSALQSLPLSGPGQHKLVHIFCYKRKHVVSFPPSPDQETEELEGVVGASPCKPISAAFQRVKTIHSVVAFIGIFPTPCKL